MRGSSLIFCLWARAAALQLPTTQRAPVSDITRRSLGANAAGLAALALGGKAAVAAEEARSKREADQRETAARQRQLFKEVDDENTKYDAQVAGPSVVGAVLRMVG